MSKNSLFSFVFCAVGLSTACSPPVGGGLPPPPADVSRPDDAVDGARPTDAGADAVSTPDVSVPPADIAPTGDVVSAMDVTPQVDVVTPPVDVVLPPDMVAPPDVPMPPGACERPGAIEMAPCGMCGTLERFCNAMRRWENGACMNQGVCMPGTTTTRPCGRCGTQAVRCNDRCQQVDTGMCTGEGMCTPGETLRTAAGCPAGQSRVLRCTMACAMTDEVEPCRMPVGVDVNVLVDVTGSFQPQLTAMVSTLRSRLADPVVAMPESAVGVAFFSDFGISPYGVSGDRAYTFGAEPSTTAASFSTALSGRPMISSAGGDGSDSVVEALGVLAGLPAHRLITSPPMCSAGRAAGGCWRSGTRRVIVVVGDSASHNGPPPAGGTMPSDPYTTIMPTPTIWRDLVPVLQREQITVLFVTLSSAASVLPQHRQMVSDLGQPASDVFTLSSVTPSTALDQVVARVAQIRMR